MTSSLTLQCGDLRCELKPELGGCIAGLWWGDVPVLRSTPAAELHSVRNAASYPLVPFSNRVSQAVLQWNGTDHPLVKNWAPSPHAIHGLGWERPWSVLESGPAFALLSFEHRADAGWPFDFDASQAFKLEADALEMTLSITNQSPVSVPVGLGWHPFFVKRPDSHVAFQASGRWEMGPDQLPTHRAPHDGLQTDTAELTVDHCFDGWKGTLDLQDGLVKVRVESSLRHLVVYTLPGRDTIAIEPVSHVNNAVNLLAQGGFSAQDLGVVVLQPGQSFSCDMRITIARNH